MMIEIRTQRLTVEEKQLKLNSSEALAI